MKTIKDVFSQTGLQWKIKPSFMGEVLKDPDWAYDKNEVRKLWESKKHSQEAKMKEISIYLTEILLGSNGYLRIENPEVFFEATGGTLEGEPLKVYTYAIFISRQEGIYPTIPSRLKFMHWEVEDEEQYASFYERMMPGYEIQKVFLKEEIQTKIKMMIANRTFDLLNGDQFQQRWEMIQKKMAKAAISKI